MRILHKIKTYLNKLSIILVLRIRSFSRMLATPSGSSKNTTLTNAEIIRGCQLVMHSDKQTKHLQEKEMGKFDEDLPFSCPFLLSTCAP